MSMAMGIGAALGSWLSGLLHQTVGGYTASFGLAVLGSTIGMLVFLLVPSLRHERLNARAQK
jgi:dipeptide/tripeptide permease